MLEKLCPSCNEVKNVSEFYGDKRRKDGLRCYCKLCEKSKNASREHIYKAQRKAYRQTDKFKQIKRNYYQKNKDKILVANKKWLGDTKNGRLANYKNSAKSRSIEWKLSDDEFFSFWQQPCSYCGSEIKTIGLDRIDSSGPYIITNIVSCCSSCNKMKMDMKQNLFLKQIEAIYEYQIRSR